MNFVSSGSNLPGISVTPLDRDTFSVREVASPSLLQPQSILWSEAAGSQGFQREKTHCGVKEGKGVRKQTVRDSTSTNLKQRERDYRSFAIVWMEICQWGHLLHWGDFPWRQMVIREMGVVQRNYLQQTWALKLLSSCAFWYSTHKCLILHFAINQLTAPECLWIKAAQCGLPRPPDARKAPKEILKSWCQDGALD